jgi:TM2 domain-containing membrane protein YozV
MQQQKVWLIEDDTLRLPVPRKPKTAISDPADVVTDDPESAAAEQAGEAGGRQNPLWSISLALLVPGSGHLYLGYRRQGFWFMGAALAVTAAVLTLIMIRETVYRALAAYPEHVSMFLISFLCLSLVGLGLWLASAADACRRTMLRRREGWPGLDNPAIPLVCSLVLPGWGQLLNGQFKKGLLFLCFGCLGCFALEILAVGFYFWPLIQPGPLRGLIDWVLIISFLAAPLMFSCWLAAGYDAYLSGQRLARQRFSRAVPSKRVGGPGFARMLVPRTSAVLCLLLAISLGMQLLPKDYYASRLERVQAGLLEGNFMQSSAMLAKVVALMED